MPGWSWLYFLPSNESGRFLRQVDVHAGTLHDAVLAWAYGVNATLAQGGQPDDGLSVAGNIFNLTFQGMFADVTDDPVNPLRTAGTSEFVPTGVSASRPFQILSSPCAFSIVRVQNKLANNVTSITELCHTIFNV